MTPKPDSMFVQKSIYDFLEDFECKRPVRWDPLISIYKNKEEENDIGENEGEENDIKSAGHHDDVDKNDEEKSVVIAKDPRKEGALASRQTPTLLAPLDLKSSQNLTPLKIVVDDIELDENTSPILFEDPTISLGPFAIYENYKDEIYGYNVPPLEIKEYQNIMDNVYLNERIYRYPDLENSAHWSVPNPYGTIGMVPVGLTLLESAAITCKLEELKLVNILGTDERTPEELESNGKISVPYQKESNIYFLCNP